VLWEIEGHGWWIEVGIGWKLWMIGFSFSRHHLWVNILNLHVLFHTFSRPETSIRAETTKMSQSGT
jgi:hypothetical protein